MTAIIVFCILCLLLVTGKLLRLSVPILQRLYLPSSVVGGIVGLVLISVFRDRIPGDWIGIIKQVPGFLINVVFASLFLGKMTPAFKKIWSLALPQLCMGQLLAWGQYVFGLGLCGLLLIPCFGVPEAFGNLLEIGFQGGHGTVGGLISTFENYNWTDGIALGFTMATAGMVLGIVVGMVLVNWALRKGAIGNVRMFGDRNVLEQRGIYRVRLRPDAGKQTVFSDSIDSLAWHIALIGLAILIGFGMLKGLQWAEVELFPGSEGKRIFSGFPLFPLCMIGGLLLQKLMQRLRMHKLIDHGQMQRLAGASLDFLVVSAVATIQISVVAANWKPLLILIVAGTLWSVILVVWLAPRLFKEAWFERAISEFGQSLGVTATGLLLLRTVDPENKTVAAESFGYKQLLHEPFMGGGLWTALALTLVFNIGWFKLWLICCGAFAVWWIITGFILVKNRR
ncbi:MAG: sodium:glutamate symporter [Lentisphaeria bacterium]|nr:sodium:glutamate symporter [Lentisphaeria bacterium]